ncbi:hypothetical protein LINGRAHAP2_LOCUS10427 [Linum grandiflorum]
MKKTVIILSHLKSITYQLAFLHSSPSKFSPPLLLDSNLKGWMIELEVAPIENYLKKSVVENGDRSTLHQQLLDARNNRDQNLCFQDERRYALVGLDSGSIDDDARSLSSIAFVDGAKRSITIQFPTFSSAVILSESL